MNLTAQDYQIAAFFGLIAIFEICERIWPAQPVNRWKDLKLDVLSFAFALLVNRLCTYSVTSFFATMSPEIFVRWTHWLQSLSSPLRIFIAIVMVDFILYWIHRAQHRFNFMWRTHSWHHSVEEMYWFAGFRTSFLHSFFYNIPQVFVPMMIFKLSPAEAGIGYSIGLFIQFWEHTNLKVNIGPLAWILVTPDYHRIHHSATEQRGMNLAPTFRIWDRLFGTYVDPASVPEVFPMGLGERIEPKKIPRMLIGV